MIRESTNVEVDCVRSISFHMILWEVEEKMGKPSAKHWNWENWRKTIIWPFSWDLGSHTPKSQTCAHVIAGSPVSRWSALGFSLWIIWIPYNQPTNQATNQPTNQSTNQPTNQPTTKEAWVETSGVNSQPSKLPSALAWKNLHFNLTNASLVTTSSWWFVKPIYVKKIMQKSNWIISPT